MSEYKKIVLLGTGGHCKVVLDSILASSYYKDICIVGEPDENMEGISPMIMGVPIVGTDDDLSRLYSEGFTEAFVAIGSTGDVSLRRRLYGLLKKIGFHLPNIIDKTSIVSKYANLGEGNYIGKNVVINAYASIGNCAIINTAALVEHECNIGDFVHISPGSILCGNVDVADDTHVGAGSIIKQNIQVGSASVIGMGSVVIKDIGSKAMAYGNPCKEV